MAFGGFNKDGAKAPLAEINMVPLIDVMLVLLVVFIITAPLLTHAVKIDLPKASSHPNQTKSDNVQIAIRADGQYYWSGEAVDREELHRRILDAATLSPQPEIHLRADRTAQYQLIAEVMADASKAGLVRIGFVSDPNPVR
ncbi:biopolymer transporter ExbD [Rhodocyclus tenuis]|uniref:Biopolymer transporter ExbD n=2 Tax=Rhodocyclus TaxID=1064 RepID=A0A6L5JZU5_RHOTE|nr:biopolymer transporter ExbD [Rhodocyclus gracilis]MQY52362.1 biopolymer transporter ExbD [Rhodocyclus gracilis]MRD73959.1 biopolymer transporter ExbD [Rhodocyclus gracilis]NJA90124.1 biopolymer transporter ExbD [Rhodocyclus gracilis]